MNLSNTFNKILLPILLTITIIVTAFFAWNYFKKDTHTDLIIGAGSKKGEAYKFA